MTGHTVVSLTTTMVVEEWWWSSETGEGNPTMNDLGFEGLVTNYALATKNYGRTDFQNARQI